MQTIMDDLQPISTDKDNNDVMYTLLVDEKKGANESYLCTSTVFVSQMFQPQEEKTLRFNSK